MRPFFCKTVLLCVSVCCVAGTTCGVNVSPFPKRDAWTRRTVASAPNGRPSVVAVSDFDGDGRLDIVAGYQGTSGTTPAVLIFFQATVDSFTAVQVASSADLSGVAALAVADLDSDTHSDIVAACSGRLVYLHSPVDPRVAAGWALSTIDQSTGSGIGQWNDLAVGDIDRQRGPDIVACNASGRLSWFQAPVTATSGTGWVRVDVDTTTRTGAASVALGNVSGGAGWLDIISTAASETSARVAWYQNPTNPATDAWTKRTIGNLAAATRLAVGDLNRDSRTDVLVTNPTDRQIGWYARPSDATTTWTGYQLARYTADTPTDVKVADVDGNGQLDVVVATQSAGSLRWFTPIGAQTLGWAENNLADLSEAVGRIALGDINADGRPDVIAPLQAATADQDLVAWFENPEP